MYQAQFCKVDGLDDTDVGPSIGLQADNKDAAEDEALALQPVGDANFVKVLRDGMVVAKLGFAL